MAQFTQAPKDPFGTPKAPTPISTAGAQAPISPVRAPASPESPKTGPSRGLNGVLVVLFALMLEITVAVSFYFSAAADAMLMLPDSGDEADGGFFASVFPTIICLVLVLLLLVMIILVNRRSSRHLFMALGMAFALSGILGVILGLVCPAVVTYLPDAMRDGLIESAPALGNLLIVLALACFVIASVFISLSRISKRRKEGATHE